MRSLLLALLLAQAAGWAARAACGLRGRRKCAPAAGVCMRGDVNVNGKADDAAFARCEEDIETRRKMGDRLTNAQLAEREKLVLDTMNGTSWGQLVENVDRAAPRWRRRSKGCTTRRGCRKCCGLGACGRPRSCRRRRWW